MKKFWWQSKTIWYNLAVSIAAVVGTATGLQIPEEGIIGLFSVGNVILRLVTKQGLQLVLLAAVIAPSVMLVSGCSPVREFVNSNPMVVDAGTSVACGQAACRIKNENDRALFASQLNACSAIIEAGCQPVARKSGSVAPADPEQSLILQYPNR
mgnify:CR=1 FL=1